MLIDHITAIFVPEDYYHFFWLRLGSYELDVTLYVIGRAIGRIAFPLFAFLIVQGFLHTRNVKKYMLRLGIFALISEIPYDFAFYGFPNPIRLFEGQNIFFTLLIGLIAITLIDRIQKNYQKQLMNQQATPNSSFFMNFNIVLVIVGASLVLYWIRGSYYYNFCYGVLLIIGLFLTHRSRLATLIMYILLTGFLCGGVQFMAIFAAPLIYFYNGEKGPSCKYAFYVFYPVHLVILKLIQLALI